MIQLLNWFRRGNLESGLDRELQYHIDRRVSDLMPPVCRSRRRGGERAGARRLTQVREEVRDVWLTRWLRDFVYDLRFSARSFLRSPSFTATACFRSHSALARPPPSTLWSIRWSCTRFRSASPERLVLIDWKGDHVAGGFGSWNLMSYPICRDLQLQDRFFDGVLCRAATR